MEQRQRERERNKTAELVDKQAREMLELYKQARQEVRDKSIVHAFRPICACAPP